MNDYLIAIKKHDSFNYMFDIISRLATELKIRRNDIKTEYSNDFLLIKATSDIAISSTEDSMLLSSIFESQIQYLDFKYRLSNEKGVKGILVLKDSIESYSLNEQDLEDVALDFTEGVHQASGFASQIYIQNSQFSSLSKTESHHDYDLLTYKINLIEGVYFLVRITEDEIHSSWVKHIPNKNQAEDRSLYDLFFDLITSRFVLEYLKLSE